MVPNDDLSKPARLLLLVSLLSRDRVISHNGKGFLKELILRRDPAVIEVFAGFGSHPDFLEQVNELIDRESGRLFDELFADCSLSEGKSLSKAERRRKGLLGDKGLIYGEVEFFSFAAVLREVMARMPSDPGKVFYDLGSGTGKAVYVARLTQDFAHCVGIELLEPLHSAAERVTNLYNAKFRQCLDSTRPQHAAVYLGSFLEYDWSDGDVVFANSTCFPEGLMERLTNQAEELKPGAVVITFTKMLESSCFDLLEKSRFDMSWGPATVFIHRRRPRGDIPTRPPPPMFSRNAPRGAIYSADGASSGIRRIEREWHCGSPGITGASTGREFQYDQGRNRGSGMAVGSFGRQEEEEEKEARGDAQEVSPDKGVLLFDAKQGVKVQGGDRNGTAPMNKRFMEFRELLQIAEQTQREVFERLRISREELMALPGDLETDCLGGLDANMNRKTSGMEVGGEQIYNKETGVFRSGNRIVGGDASSRSGRDSDYLGSMGVSVTGRGAAAASPDDAGGCFDRGSHPPFFSEKYASLAGKTTEEASAVASLAPAAAVKEGAGGRLDASNASGRRVGLSVEVGDDNTDPRVGNTAYYEDVEGVGSVIFASEVNVDKGVQVSEDRPHVVAAAGVIGKGLGEEGKALGTNAVGSEDTRNKEDPLGQDVDLVPLACEADDDALAERLPTGDINDGERGACGDSDQTRLPGTPLVVVSEGGTRMLSIDTAVVSAVGKECSREQPHQACTLSSAGAATSSTSYPPCGDYDDKGYGDRAEALSHESRCGDRADVVDPGSGVVLPPPPTVPGALSSKSSVGRNNDSAGQVPQLPLPPVDVYDDNSEAVPDVGT